MLAKYRDQVHFVVVYVIEPHPVGSRSPYSDTERPSRNSYDTEGNPIKQPETYEERVRLASLCSQDAGITAVVLVDEPDNPIWEAYGPAPNLAYLIGTDGTIAEAQRWYDVARMESAIARYLKILNNER